MITFVTRCKMFGLLQVYINNKFVGERENLQSNVPIKPVAGHVLIGSASLLGCRGRKISIRKALTFNLEIEFWMKDRDSLIASRVHSPEVC